MSVARERLQAAAFESALSAIERSFLDIPDDLIDQAEEYTPGISDLVLGGLTYTRSLLRVVSADLLIDSQINIMSSHLAQMRGAITNLADSRNVAHAGDLRDFASSMVSTITTWPVTNRLTVANAPSFANALSASVESSANKLAAEIREIDTKASKVSLDIDSQTSKISLLEDRVQEVQNIATESRESLNTIQKSFLEDQLARGKEFEANVSEWQKIARAAQKSLDEKIGQFQADSTHALRIQQGELDEQLARASKVVQLITLSGTSSEYRNEVNQQRTAANKWRLVAIGLGSVALTVAIYAALFAQPSSLSETITRLTVSLVTLGLAGYAAAQSSQHRKREEQAKRHELILVAFDPFVQDLPEEARRTLKEHVSQRIFSDLSSPAVTPSAEQTASSDALTLLGQIVDLLRTRGAV